MPHHTMYMVTLC